MCEAERQAEAVVRGCANPSSPGVVLFAPFSDGGYLGGAERRTVRIFAAPPEAARSRCSRPQVSEVGRSEGLPLIKHVHVAWVDRKY